MNGRRWESIGFTGRRERQGETAGHEGTEKEQIRKKNGGMYKKHSEIRKRLLIHDKAG